jgi:Wiskott-Aldrich syndrome protein
LGRVTSGAAIQIAGDAAQCLGVRFLADGVSGALQSVLLTPGTDIDQFSLHAVIQGRPDADYQRIINALIKLHQQQQHRFSLMKLQMPQPPPPAIDYQAMIDEVQRLQALAQQVTTAQHQQLAQLHAGAQLQVAQQQHVLQSPQQKQQQTAAQQYQALVQQRYQQQQHLQQVPAQQQQQQAAIQAQQNQALLNTYPQPPQQPPQIMQSTIQPYLFQHLNHQSPQAGGDTGGNQAQPSFDPISLY